VARYTAEHKDETRERILKAAAKEFRSRGYADATVPGIMETAGLTVGGFYKHFESKAALFVEMFRETFEQSANRTAKLSESVEGRDWLRAIADTYLTIPHRDNLRGGCVMAALASEMPRAEREARQAYEDALMPSFDRVAEVLDGDRDRAIAFRALLIGGLVLARGMATDEAAEEILRACRKSVEELIER
jgi:AcrR family transcriptional regulator